MADFKIGDSVEVCIVGTIRTTGFVVIPAQSGSDEPLMLVEPLNSGKMFGHGPSYAFACFASEARAV